ncbi:SMP-30/gluconolactonase/LRE family protein [Kineosporia mesophila]|uniref:SMP-30/gluconolactonase/LRE family protein n=1 Tax=Kineosporia mesophila TaxID=566012 RepID=A0ABP7AN57_9ACTN|nr:SMP-30/gluconolactonase/LRE family protein [Kineosporia mesophila]MCD5349336.1 SMP-30/gluconolactonase/LRE family protein [Kineosporia mesophila]
MFEIVGGSHCVLGEGPMWDAEREIVRWVDIEGGRVWEGLDSPRVVLKREPTLGAVIHSEAGDLLLARQRGLEHVDVPGDVVATVTLVPDGVNSRLNDGKCDPAGRFLVGSMALDDRRGSERLWRLEHDGGLTVLDDDLSLSNGLGWSPDGATMYQVDTVPGMIWRRTYDPDTGAAGRRHLLVAMGGADGLTVDAAGNLWVAVWGAGQVRVLSPRGVLLEEFDTGAPLTTSCAFTGPDLDLLVVTTADRTVAGVPRSDRAGSVLTLRTTHRGLPTTPWRPGPLSPSRP